VNEKLYSSSKSSRPTDVQELFIDIRKILLATDGSKSAISATKHAMGWARIFKANVRAIFVDADNGLMSTEFIDEYTESSLMDKKGYNGLLIAKGLAQKNNVSYEEMVVIGNVARSIIESAQEYAPDLIIIGNSEKSGIRRSLGSTADAVMKGTDIPVLIINSN